ncbi:NAD-dependent epimerase/dehydratase family protein [Streptomyces olivaceoviridis]|uniref:NAD-dependent epimerase/dehydratase family protein n=1 Tax=Streptomyces olivaceoviridis TaxID=1921 RepID=UPI0036FDD5BB
MRNVLVTGAAGFIGRNICHRLSSEGLAVRGVDNFSVAPTGQSPMPIERKDVRHLTVSDLSNVDTVIHLAALKSVPGSFSSAENLTHNLSVDHHILALHHASSCPRLLMASTCEVYGQQGGYNRESDALAPRSPYAVGKAASEMLADVYRTLNLEKQIGVVRFFNTYGPDEGGDAVVPAFLDSVADGRPCEVEGDGTQARDMTHIDDMVAMLWQVLAHEQLPHTINLGSGTAVPIRKLAAKIVEIEGQGAIRHTQDRPNEIAAFTADMHRYIGLFGNLPSRSLDEGLRAAHKQRHLLRQDGLLGAVS